MGSPQTWTGSTTYRGKGALLVKTGVANRGTSPSTAAPESGPRGEGQISDEDRSHRRGEELGERPKKKRPLGAETYPTTGKKEERSDHPMLG